MGDLFNGFLDMPSVLATAKLVALVEVTCLEALVPYLERGECTVGTDIAITHCAATPVGMKVSAHVKLLETGCRRFRFRVRCFDDKESIGVGEHERAVVNRPDFADRADRKRGAATNGMA